VAGTLRFFADRFGVPRAAIEGTTLSYDLIRRYARQGPAEIEVSGPRKHQGLTLRRRLSYFGFELDALVEPLEGEVPAELRPVLVEGLVKALLGGETAHPSQARVRRAAAELSELWRRSGGTLEVASPAAVRDILMGQLAGVTDWRGFLGTPLGLEPAALVPAPERQRLLSLPDKARVLGDVVPIRYELGESGGVARIELREGQARRVSPADLPTLDRPVRFAVVRGNRPALVADSLDALRAALKEDATRERRARFKPPRHRRR
jgi:hypothetical protein